MPPRTPLPSSRKSKDTFSGGAHFAKFSDGDPSVCLAPRPASHACPEAVLPDRALHLPTLSHLLIVNRLISPHLSTPLQTAMAKVWATLE